MLETTVGALLGELAGMLTVSRVPDAGREAREIVASLYDVPRFWPSVNAHAGVAAEMRVRAREAAAMRARGAPLAYAVGRAAFRNLTLQVDPRVLIPRPETELLVDLVLSELGPLPGGIAVDVGTGSGAIALALATEGHFDRVYATDVSLDALAVARENAAMLPAAVTPVEFLAGSMLAPVAHIRPRVIVSNPPYIAYPEAAALPAAVRDWEPTIALFSGADGLTATERIIGESAALLEAFGVLALEVDARRASLVVELISRDSRFVDIGVRLDLAGRERFVLARRRENS
ncbi:MAG TPA: peptide chain release factor N(5)-glutamine methyltransferase [Gemmatimonadaceae bacterium]|nr:peptide chain release factor N(5)-glutamine methyltransferase [Gemmatimonadaceae bacterium]